MVEFFKKFSRAEAFRGELFFSEGELFLRLILAGKNLKRLIEKGFLGHNKSGLLKSGFSKKLK
jgi:hypothetical protein